MTWRVTGVALAVLLTWYFTGDPRLGMELGIAYNAIRLVTHYGHDRGWARVRWGMEHAAEGFANGLYSQETKLRTFVRSLTWRISGVVLTVLLAVLFTGDLKLGVELGVSYNLIRLSTHYFHDRAWARWSWGMVHHARPEPEPREGFLRRLVRTDVDSTEILEAAPPAPDREPEPEPAARAPRAQP